jgi:hypothetical protein
MYRYRYPKWGWCVPLLLLLALMVLFSGGFPRARFFLAVVLHLSILHCARDHSAVRRAPPLVVWPIPKTQA